MAGLEKQQPSKHGPDLASLCPSLSPAQLEEARDNLRQYVALALRVLERLEQDPEAMARFEALTASRREHKMNEKRPPTNSSDEK
jgi:hypothetical protein